MIVFLHFTCGMINCILSRNLELFLRRLFV